MKLLLPPLALFLFSYRGVSDDAVALRFEPEEGTVLKRTFEAAAEYRLADLTASVDGEPLERSAELPEDSSSFLEHIAVTDTLGASEDGRPAEVVRMFDELRQENEDSASEDSTSTFGSPLQGRKVRFSWDAEEERYTAEPADDEELDESLAQWLAEDMDLRLVLPPGEVEPGDDWEVDPELYLAFMWPSGLLDFRAEGDEPGDDERAMSRQTIERLEGTGTARLEEVREEDGNRVAVIEVELELTTGSDGVLEELEVEGELVRPEMELEIEHERSLTGTILWDLEHGHALSAELECQSSRLLTRSFTLTGEQDGEEVELELEETYLYEGTIRYTATIERE